MTSVWDNYISDDGVHLLRRAGYGLPQGLGKRPAVLVPDCQHNHIGLDRPILEQLDAYPTGGGERAWVAVRQVESVLPVARKHGAPVIYTKYCYEQQEHRVRLVREHARESDTIPRRSPGTEIVPDLLPQESELVIKELHASAFFGTGLIRYLVDLGIDTFRLTGVSTSGWVRTTAI